MRFKSLAQPGQIGKMKLKNRIIFPPVNNNNTHTAFMTEESLEFYAARARGGCSLIIVEATSVDYPRSRSVLNPAINDDKYIPGLKAIADACHQYDAKCAVQLSHVGRQTRKAVTGMDPIAPSAIASTSALYPDTPKVLTIPDIKELITMYGNAAIRAQKAEMDAVEIIMGHGYLLNNFLSPFSNKRTDEYAGLKGGIKFCVEIIREIKNRCGEDFPIICRYNIDDFMMTNGNTAVEGQLIAQELERAGADCINASGGLRDSNLNYADHTFASPHGGWLHLADRVKRVVDIPVMAVKRLTPEIAEEALRSGQANFICFGKQLLADPDFANKILADTLEDVAHCSSCCQGCYDVLWMRQPITCMVNPSMGRKMAYLKEREARKGDKKVLIVGAGPAGCETALEAAKKGHTVVLIEKSGELGGQYGTCRYTETKKEVATVFEHLAVALKKNGVEVRLNTAFSPALLDEIKPQVVVDATGSEFKMPNIEGIDLPIVVDPVEALNGSVHIGKYVAVVSCGHNCTWTCRVVSHPIPDDVVGLQTCESHACSAGHAAADVAEELARRGKVVSVIAGREAFVPGMGYTNRGNMLKRFFSKYINVSNNVKVKKIVPDGLICEKEGMEFKVCADTVVMSTGMNRHDFIEEQVKDKGIEFFRAGDAAEIGNALFAFHSGYEVVDKF